MSKPQNWNEVDLIFRGHHEPMSSAASRMANTLRERAAQHDEMNEEERELTPSTTMALIPKNQTFFKNALAAAKALLFGLSTKGKANPGSYVTFSDEI